MHWVENALTITGQSCDVATFVAAAEGARHRFADQAEETFNIPLSFQRIVPLPEDGLRSTYDPRGYLAEILAWGVKWGAGNVTREWRRGMRSGGGAHADGEVTYRFRTANACAMPWFVAAAARFDAVTFACSWGGGGPKRGRFVAHSGILVTEVEGERYCGPLPLTPEDQALEVAWREAYVAAHQTWVDEMRLERAA